MSLRVWLPLNKDLRNNGLENVTVTNNGATFADGAASFTTSQYISLPITSLTHASVSFWIKLPSSKTTWLPFSNNGSRWLMACDGGGNFYFSSDVTGSKIIYMDGNVVTRMATDGNWHHYTIVDISFSGWSAFYINHYNSSAYNWEGQFYDFRIYDHALSLKEVKELAKGLYLHYTFDDPYIESTVNLIKSESSISGHGSYWGLQTEKFQGQNVYKNIVSNPGNVGGNAGFRLSTSSYFKTDGISSATNITISFYKRLNVAYDKSLATMSYIRMVKSDDTEQQYTFTFNKSNWSTDSTSIGKWERITGTVTIPSGCKNIKYMYIYADNANTGDCDFSMIQLEAKNHATPYTPSSRNVTTIHDNSGFNNDGTINGNLRILSGSARGSYCTMPVTTEYSRVYVDTLTNRIKTVSFWCYMTPTTASFSGFIFTYKPSKIAFGRYGNKRCIIYPRTSSESGADAIYTITDICDNKWHHFVMYYDNNKCNLWIDGVKRTSNGPEYWSVSYDGLCIFGRTPTSDSYNDNKISDFRMYTTILSESDIQDLYKDTFIIDDTQNSYCYEMNESDTTSEVQFNETGVAKCKNYSEALTSVYDDTEYIEPDGSVWIRIFHHNNPANGNMFSTTDTFTTNVYKDADRWFNVAVCNKVSKWELMVKECAQSNSTVHKYRWIQNINPMIATGNQVKTTDIVSITTSGYSNFTTHGGLSLYGNTPFYICQRNDGMTNAWGAVGRMEIYYGGIEGFVGGGGQYTITTGYLDLYLRIDNLDETTDTKIIENGSLTANELIEL